MGTANFGATGMYEKTGHISQKEADFIVPMVLDAGINFFNTAQRYSDGISEKVLGKALGARRNEAIIITKIHPARKPGPIEGGATRKNIIEGCEASLKRMGTDYIDIYQIHEFDEYTPLEVSLRALDDLVSQGKVRYIGCSNFAGWQLMKALAISDRNGLERFATLEARYSMASRMIEYELVPACLDQDVAILAWSPLHGGFLSGKYRRGISFPSGTRFDRLGDFFWQIEPEKLFDMVDELEVIANAHDSTISQTALNYVLRKPAISSLIIGIRTREQLEENLAATDWEMTPEEVARLDEISNPVMDYPYFAFDPKTGGYSRHYVLGTYQAL
jgi:aryl-alcohol dehydrogenase-like predicted oxidoreductase